MKRIARALGLAAWLWTTLCHATPLLRNASDLWWVPTESGWGLNIIHQGDTLFATLFVYGPDGRPTWYSASNLVTSGDGTAHDRPLVFSGALVESTGPAFGPSFNPAAVTRRIVGSMTFEMTGSSRATLTYTVDGVAVSKSLERFSFRAMDLSGDYVGYQSRPETTTGVAVTDEMTIAIRQSGTSVTMTTQGTQSGSCSYSGTLAANGQLANVSGTYTCADGRAGPFSLVDADITAAGFTARFNGNRIAADTIYGRMGGARTSAFSRGDGWRTDLWWVPTESGWGINVIEQGEILFATIFTYDAQGRPRWYSASSLAFAGRGPAVDSTGIYSGAVVESTGPYFGTSFNPVAVTRREVGTMSFDVFGNRTGFVDLSINGVTLARKQLDRYTFQVNDLSGAYNGQVHASLNSRNVPTGPTTINITRNGANLTILTQAAGGNCTFSASNGAVMQYGQQMIPAGSFTCTNGTTGQWFWYDADVSASGFTAHYTIDGYTVGNIVGVRNGVF
jgi:hypothetical protein